MNEIPTSALFYEYHGTKLRYLSGGGSWARVSVDGEATLTRFPEALEFGSDPREPWVMLPTAAFDAVYQQEAHGVWRGQPVAVEYLVRRGVKRGMANIRYLGTRPDEAVLAGLRGNQNDGWSATVDPAEIEDITVTETKSAVVR